ncbi:MAG: thioredoxin-disulfide reductase [Micrococcaceae bacterium]
MSTTHDVLIIGSGPAGYTSAIYTARAALNPVVIAGAMTAGGELMNTTEVENYPGFAQGIMGPDLMDQMQQQAERFGAEIVFDDVTAVDLSSTPKKITISDGTEYYGKAVIISTGAAYRHLGVPGEEELSGHGVSWCATCDGFFFKDKDVIVVGGGDSAMEEAIFLTKFASSVKILNRSDTLRASQVMQQRAKDHELIEILYNTQVQSINGEDLVESVTVTHEGKEETIPVQGIFIAIGHDPRVDLFKDTLELTPENTIKVDGRSSKTNVEGVFAAGDVIDPTYRQAITAAGSGCVAALDTEYYLEELEEKEGK